MQPLVLAIEPDIRQAAIVKRIVREKVLADVTVVDSRDAALEAMRTTIPDVLLLSALLSPRDEDELFAHLRTLQHAEHLQTHTIPQLASTIGHDDEKPRGLLSAFRRRKGSSRAPAGCDPELFAEEVRTYLQRASEKKRELRENPARETAMPSASPTASGPGASHDDSRDADVAPPESSWASPFEWRPTRNEAAREAKPGPSARVKPVARPEPDAVKASAPVAAPAPEPVAIQLSESVVVPATEPAAVAAPESVVVQGSASIVLPDPAPVVAPDPEPVVVAAPEPVAASDPESVVVAAPQSVLIPQPRSVLVSRSETPAVAEPPRVVQRKLPLSKRHAREWWFEGEDSSVPAGCKETDSEMREVLESLSVPLHIAAIGYAEGCRIRRVRLMTE